MTVHQAEKLLGGYAAGILTEEERTVLFQAALKDQALFDALADEDVLRELLADPEAKAKLLAALAVPATPRIVPFWRRPAVMGLAASLAISVVGALAYLRSKEEPGSFLRQRQEKAIESAPQAPEPVPPTLQDLTTAPAAKAAAPKVAAPKPMVPQPSESHQQLQLREEAPARAFDRAPQPAPTAIPEKPSGESFGFQAAGSVTGRNDERLKEESTRAKKSLAKEKDSDAKVHSAGQPSPGAPSAQGGAVGNVTAERATRAPRPEPLWTLEKGASQHAKLRVMWRGNGRVVVTVQSKGVRQTLTPNSSEQKGDQHQVEYAFTLGDEDPLDLYLFPEDTDKEKGDAPAPFHRRIHPGVH